LDCIDGLVGLIGWRLVRMKLLLLAVCVPASLRTKSLRENMGQCKSEGQDFKRDYRKHGTV
jgi:hypothetical protein